MKIVVQKVLESSVTVNGELISEIKKGYNVLLGIKTTDTKAEADFLARKLINLRIFEDENDKLNLSIKDVNGEILIISQFTLYGNTKDGNRPSFIEAARPEQAIELYNYFCDQVAKEVPVKKGIFQANMKVNILNDGPTTIIIEK